MTVTGRTKVSYPTVTYDLAGEYDSAASAFIPKTSGVYAITASVNYIKNLETQQNEVNPFIIITVNGSAVDGEDDFRINPAGRSRSEITQVSDNLFLNAGDRVEVEFFPDGFQSATGRILPSLGTYFTAARVPSPAKRKDM
ncbi:hypothetical protein LRR81_03240 [Metabacillus sp. GX 13764]|uniref:hypothetical protein n=1 Tax=Metabacillus kandeliae TaxID=2900151 RepID=UPI001E572025|nr:hypothetical protein [Metabacillus kandeliae]MCD7033231.1 hypothetical protein [Metabacillus kandeliae]